MAQIEIPAFQTFRRKTRTYDTPSENTQQLFDAIEHLLPPAGTFIPTALADDSDTTAWKLCNGQALSKADYPRLFAIFGGEFGQTETTFNLPDLRGRALIGAADAIGLNALVGASSIFLAVDQLPAHAHTVTDPGHGHTFTATPHTHTVTDPGHTHTVTDPGHAHSVEQGGPAADAATGTDEVTTEAGGTSGTAATGIVIDPAQTGVTVDNAAAGGTVETAITGVTVEPTGQGAAIDITPLAMAVNWMVRT